MKKIIFYFISLLYGLVSIAQSISPADLKELKKKEDSLKQYGYNLVNAKDAGQRFRSDSFFVKILVRALKIKNSFYYPFDSVQSISRLYAPDSAFRIFSWQVEMDESINRQRGAIQVKSSDGSLKLFPLIDRSHLIKNPYDTIMNGQWWIGNIYYRIIPKESNGKKIYTLLGYDEYTLNVTRKWIDILSFTDDGEPVLGYPVFSFSEDSIPKPMQNRFSLEYKKDGRARVQYDEEMDMILFDHLISETNEPQKKYTLIPDGDYEGFKWQNGQWIHVNKVFTFKLKDGEAPIPEPLNFDNRQKIEDILNGKKKLPEQKSKRNKPKPKGQK